MSNKILFVLFLLLLSTSLLFAQPTVTLEPFGVSPAQIKADTVGNENYIGILNRVYSGLLNVGVGAQMVLKGASDTTLVTPTWNVASVPGGSSVTDVVSITDVDTATQMALFTPDVVGTYEVEFTSDGVTASVTINAGTYLGVEGGAVSCVSCHNQTYAAWSETGHAHMLTNALDGISPYRSGATCISCHTTGYDTSATAVNDGFDDFPFVYPDSIGPGMSDSMMTEYPDAMMRANIQCEACHGPGSEHMADASDSKMVSSLQTAACAQCHDDDHYHVYPSQWNAAGHSNIPSYPGGTRTDCSGCHNGAQFIQFVRGENITNQPHIDITCAVCHDPHNNTNADQLRTVSATLENGTVVTDAGKGALCMNCHKSRRDADSYTNSPGSHFGPHYAPQADMFIGTNAVTFGKTLPTSPHLAGTTDACVDCHMYEIGSHGEHDAEGNLNTAGMHSFSMVSKSGNDNVAACADCHGDIGETFAEKKYFINGDADLDGDGAEEGLQDEVHGLMDELGALLPDADPHAEVDETWTLTELKAAFNHRLVYYDHSYGIHNPAFIVSLLQVSIQALENNAVEGEIVAIDDVPNDQGKMVKVIWDKFVDDGVAADPVEKYIVKRLDTHDDVWTNVGEATADGSARYALVVPTLFDSTAASNALTSFMVVSLSEGGMTYESMTAEGYSVDNLVPMAPQGLAGMAAAGNVTLSWDEASDPDVKYYRVFRSAESGFIAAEANEIGTAASLEYVDPGVTGTVYYKVVAVDFSGNNSDASAEIEVIATAIGDMGVPAEFALSQNYPNPFNPTTHIQLSLRDAGRVTLEVYNALGQKISTLLNRDMTAGVHSVTFDGTGLSSGVYFYKVVVKSVNGNNISFQDLHKMILMK
ncbi:MAG: T9SS type A sorting domain-containing protein [Calditrichaceae bacterium]|nr:T9SS type A sorting domain-containing protein [Calditrichaceae bacterium]